MAFLIYIIATRPYKLRFSNNYEIANEIMVGFCLYHLYCFTDYIPTESLRNDIGWSLFVSICILMSISVS